VEYRFRTENAPKDSPRDGSEYHNQPLNKPKIPNVLPKRAVGTSSAVIAPLVTAASTENPCKTPEQRSIVEFLGRDLL